MRALRHVFAHFRVALFVSAIAPSGSMLLRGQETGGFDFPSARSFPRVPIFFPPNPPPLGRAIPVASGVGGRYIAPAEMAAYVNEPFYPQLASRLYHKTLNDKLRPQLDQYRAAKRELQAELRAELDQTRELDAPTRIARLQALAKRQTPRLLELEKTAEQLRRDLQSRDHTWSALREWRLGDNPQRGFSPIEIAQVMRSYAFYQNGLLPAQRRLLREIAVELLMAGENAAAAAAAQPHLFFPPEPARVLLPDDAPAHVAAKMAVYQTKKSQLKKELYDTVYSHDGARFSFLNSTLSKLAAKHTPRIAELEQLAEEIRVGLAEMPEPAQVSERSPLSPVLQSRVGALVTTISAAQREASAAIQAILARSRELPMQATHRFEADGLKYVVIASRGGRGGRGGPPPSAEDVKRVEVVRAEYAAVAEAYGRKLAEVVNEKDAITAEVAQALKLTRPEAINNALAAAVRVATARENEHAYREYRIAVFQPGLAPEQRRLLFDSVMEKLELPLPRGEPQPIQRGATW